MVSWATSDVFNRNLGWEDVRNVLIQTSETSFFNVFYADSIQTFITNQICSNYVITKIIGDLNVSSFGLYVFFPIVGFSGFTCPAVAYLYFCNHCDSSEIIKCIMQTFIV